MFIKDVFNKFKLLFSKKTPALPYPVVNNFEAKTSNFVSQLKEENLPEFSPEVLSFNTLDGAIEQYIISYLKLAQEGHKNSYTALTSIGGKLESRSKSFFG